MQDRIFQVVVPTEEEVVFKDGKRKSEQRKLFPGYILVQMNMDDESWYVVRNTPGVTGFISSEDDYDKRPKPVPLEDSQIGLHFETIGRGSGPYQDWPGKRRYGTHYGRPIYRLCGRRWRRGRE
ncbi:Transcription termination/antitermination protein NusG [Geodia barretti]|nr:Transcription termination/antitermination protein NusG [Geodia barretti]